MSQPPFSPARRPGQRLAAACALALALLAGCGGSTSQYEPFVPKRLFVFGDENSATTNTGQHWGVNGMTDTNGTPTDLSDDTLDCAVLKNWVQSLAAQYGFVFKECNPQSVAVPQAVNYAAPLSRVADVAAQIDQRVADGGFADGDIVTIMVGLHDMLDLYHRYEQNPAAGEGEVIDIANQRGRDAAAVVNRLVGMGVKVILANIPDLGVSPYAAAQDQLHLGEDRSGLLTRLTAAFNAQLGIHILLDGRFIGLVQIDQIATAAANKPTLLGLVNGRDAACTAAPPACTTATLNTASDGTAITAASYFWSAETWLGAGGHAQLAAQAVARAVRNPF